MGALQRWAGSRRLWLKAQWEQLCRIVGPPELVIHVTSETEAAESARIFPNARFVVIPHGVHVPKWRAKTTSDNLRLLFLGRLDPKKGIENLIEACGHLQRSWQCTSKSGWSLTVAGTGTASYTASLHARIEKLGLAGHLMMVGQVIDGQKEDLFANADLLVVPSFTENFAMVVVEALARGLPVLASTGTPWSRMEAKGCGLWVDNDPETLASAIRKMSNMPLDEMGARARRWMIGEFSWPAVTKELLAVYRRYLTQPESVNTEVRPEQTSGTRPATL
jgi:glycosyltransferase involved in cell wall biosynthesis